MEAISIDDLRAPDERTLSFSPLGLGGRLPPEAAAGFQQASITRFALVDGVPDDTRAAFERLQRVHTYGLLCYDLFTVAWESSALTVELALVERFMDFYGNEIPFVVIKGKHAGESRPLRAGTFADVYDALHARRGPHNHQRVHLQPRAGGSLFHFTGSFRSLVDWARAEDLLDGQRARQFEQVLIRIRNSVAHPRGSQLLAPTDSARAICDVAEIINRLWGAHTPGGRLYPAPLPRRVMAVGWADGGSGRAAFQPEVGPPEWAETGTFIVVRAVDGGDALSFHSLHEMTVYPADLLWGPGTWDDARRWIAHTTPEPDEAQYLDRSFVLSAAAGRVGAPMRPEVAAGVDGSDGSGEWYAVRSDFPTDAIGHVRSSLDAERRCSAMGSCRHCPAQGIARGTLDDVLAGLAEEGIDITAARPATVAVPRGG